MLGTKTRLMSSSHQSLTMLFRNTRVKLAGGSYFRLKTPRRQCLPSDERKTRVQSTDADTNAGLFKRLL